LYKKYSDLAVVAKGEAQTVQVVTDLLTVNLSTKGGVIESAYLNEYKTFDGRPLPIVMSHPDNEFFFEFPFDNRAIRSDELFFSPSESSVTVHGTDSTTLRMRAALDDSRYIEQVYTFYGDQYDFGYSIRMKGLRESIGNVTFYDLQWKSILPKTELSLQNMRAKTGIVYRLGNDVEKMSISNDPETEKLGALVKWVSYKSQFFSHILIADKPLRSGTVSMRTPASDTINRVMESRFIVDMDNLDDVQTDFSVYMGPNEYTTLRSYKLDLEDQMDLGWSLVAWINKGTTYVFKFLERYISNYGIIVILLAFLIRLLMAPLSHKSYVSMAKMRVLNGTPEMKALDEKYKSDPQKLQMEKMKIYRETGVSMFGGCLPMLLSYPFLIALFFFFPQSVELRQQSFLWADDLSTYDSILSLPFEIPLYGDHVSLFTLLMAISTFVYTYFQQQSQPATGGTAASQMKYIAYFMPIFLMVFLNNYASGLSLYYFISNLFQIIQTTVIRYFLVDDQKILAQIRDAQKNAKKKGGKGGSPGKSGQSKNRLERWLENQQKKQEQAMKRRQQDAAPNRRSRRKK
ncbi:MAG: membrane protein insertase YidC, partial [Bacteroidetes bacterium]